MCNEQPQAKPERTLVERCVEFYSRLVYEEGPLTLHCVYEHLKALGIPICLPDPADPKVCAQTEPELHIADRTRTKDGIAMPRFRADAQRDKTTARAEAAEARVQKLTLAFFSFAGFVGEELSRGTLGDLEGQLPVECRWHSCPHGESRICWEVWASNAIGD